MQSNPIQDLEAFGFKVRPTSTPDNTTRAREALEDCGFARRDTAAPHCWVIDGEGLLVCSSRVPLHFVDTTGGTTRVVRVTTGFVARLHLRRAARDSRPATEGER